MKKTSRVAGLYLAFVLLDVGVDECDDTQDGGHAQSAQHQSGFKVYVHKLNPGETIFS